MLKHDTQQQKSAGYRSNSIRLVWQELAGQHHVDAVSVGVFFTLDIHGEIDGAHDAVTELLMDQLLDGGCRRH